MRFVVSWILLTVLLFSYYSNGQNLHIKLIGVDFKVDEEYFTKPLIRINNAELYDPTIDVDGRILQEINDLNIKFILKTDTPERAKDFLTTLEFNVCDYLDDPKQIPFLKVILDDMSNHGNFSTTCPLPKGGYYMHDFKLHSSLIPAFISPGKFQLDALVIKDSKIIFKAIWDADIMSD